MSAFLQSLADALNASEADVRAALDAFAARLRARVAQEGTVTYHGLGTFRRDGDRLAFEPDESVALVINHRYAGMEPIALSEGAPPLWQPGLPDDEHPLGAPPPEVFEDVPFEDAPFEDAPFEDVPVEDLSVEPAEPEPDFGAPEVEEEAVWSDVPPPTPTPDLPPLFASDETLLALRDAARDMEGTPPSEEADEWAAQMIEEEETPAPADEPEAEDDLPPPPLSPAAVPIEAHMEMPQEYEPEFEEEPEPEQEPEPVPAVLPVAPPPAEPPRAERLRTQAEPEPARRFPWLPALLLLLLVAVLAVLFLRRPAPVETPVVPPVASADTTLTSDTTAAAAATSGDTTATEPEAPAAAPPETRPEAEADGALRGTEPVVAGRGYTIVIGGGTQAQASRLAEQFRQQGYRAGVLAGRTDAGATIHRAAIGQFSSVREAQAALGRVPDLPAGAWILNLSSSLVRSE